MIRRMTLFTLLALACIACGAPQNDQSAEPATTAEPMAAAAGASATAQIEAKSGSTVSGTAHFESANGVVTLTLTLAGLPAGVHAVHLHELGDCSADDGTSAGGHWNPTGMDHGKWGDQPFHLGDIGNVEAGEDGTASYTMDTDLWSIDTGDPNDIVGHAIIVHSGIDDFSTQPTGAAGGRIGCGVVELDAQ